VIVDFHSHTNASDGTLEPRELVAAMHKRGVGIFSITDHDTMRAYDGLQVDGAHIVPGIEINTTWRGNDVHVLGYGLPLGPSPLVATLEKNRAARVERMQLMVAQLRAAGYEISAQSVLAESGNGHAIGRPHVAKALVRAGLVRDVDTAFRTLLGSGGAGYVPSLHITPMQAVDVIVRSGGIPVLAHPGRLKDESIIDDLAALGLQGLEVFYSTHSASQTAHYRQTAARLGLVMTAGSDFHDARWNVRGVGMDVDEDDLRPFLELVAPARSRRDPLHYIYQEKHSVMTDQEVQPFVGKPVRVTLADTRILAGTLHADSNHGHGHVHYAVVSDPVQPGGDPVQEVIHGAAQITDIQDAADDPAAVE
jgi:predicted metal-dependent phosphoesterase TrpH